MALALAPGGGDGTAGAGTGAGTGGAGAPAVDELLRQARFGGLILGCLALALGAFVLSSARAGVRERGWELEAVGVAGLGIGWLAGVALAVGR
jgi:hypothetical protein